MKKTIDALRNNYVSLISKLMAEQGEEVLRTGTNEIAIPCVDEEGEDQFVVITVKIPKGTRDGDLYDGYAEAEDYEQKTAAKADKAKEAAAKKEAKIKRDAEARAQRAAAKAAHQGKAE